MNYSLVSYYTARPVSGLILSKQLMVKGFSVTRLMSRWPEAFAALGQWIAEVSHHNLNTGR